METIFFVADETSRLDDLLRKKLPPYFGGDVPVSNSKIRRLIVAGAVFSDGVQRRIPAYTVKKGSRIEVKIDRGKFFYEKQNDDISFELSKQSILYEDDFLIIVDKPDRFLTEPTVAGKRGNMHDAVIAWLWKENPSLRNKPYAGIMHRLDRTTSGVLLFTKQRSVNARMHELFESGGVEKTYRALAAKPLVPPDAQFSVESRIGKLGGSGMWGEVGDGQGRFARTDFTVLGECVRNGKKLLKIEARPITGRTHQIRIHLASSGMPIFGDERYGGTEILRGQRSSTYKAFIQNCFALCPRQALHAKTLGFVHPSTGRQMDFDSEWPDDFSQLIAKWRGYISGTTQDTFAE